MVKTLSPILLAAILSGCQTTQHRPMTQQEWERNRYLMDVGLEMMHRGVYGNPYIRY